MVDRAIGEGVKLVEEVALSEDKKKKLKKDMTFRKALIPYENTKVYVI